MTTISDVYSKCINGRPLTMKEIDIGIEHFDKMSKLLFASGPVFSLAAVEANRIYLMLDGFKMARQRNR